MGGYNSRRLLAGEGGIISGVSQSQGQGPSGYIYDASTEQERVRLGLLSRANDPATIEHLEGVGVAAGWRCLEVGGGGGSIARWLCERVGPSGGVVATDLDTRFLDEIDAPNLEVRRHDILKDELESESFDLVHSRFLLEHLAEYRTALDRMIAAVKPGGWLVAEDVDFAGAILADADQRAGVPPESVATFVELSEKLLGMATGGGIQPELGRQLPVLLHEAGLVDVGAEGRTRFFWSQTEQSEVGRLSIERVTQFAVSGGFITEDDRERYLRLFTDPGIGSYTPFVYGAWGRKPQAS
jgi:2-polyprenyl-3-methyl-5-hydroxy-6-metoxy-1,4-benzoquinol methylase